MRCGSCGGRRVTLSGVAADLNSARLTQLVATCDKCESKTVFKIEQPVISVEWYPDSAGVLTFFPKD